MKTPINWGSHERKPLHSLISVEIRRLAGVAQLSPFRKICTGRVIKCLTVDNDATHEAVVIEVERAICGMGVTHVMDRLAQTRGLPKVIRSDNGKEFCGKASRRGKVRRTAWPHTASR